MNQPIHREVSGKQSLFIKLAIIPPLISVVLMCLLTAGSHLMRLACKDEKVRYKAAADILISS